MLSLTLSYGRLWRGSWREQAERASIMVRATHAMHSIAAADMPAKRTLPGVVGPPHPTMMSSGYQPRRSASYKRPQILDRHLPFSGQNLK